jgi:hypothetical protein
MTAPAFFCRAETEQGRSIEDPSEDVIYMLIQDLAHPDNTFITIEPPPGGSPWHIVISLLPDQTFEVEYKDLARGEHRVETQTRPGHIAHDATIWLADAGRYYQERDKL